MISQEKIPRRTVLKAGLVGLSLLLGDRFWSSKAESYSYFTGKETSFEIPEMPGFRYGLTTSQMDKAIDNKLYEYNKEGITDDVSTGIRKGSFFIEGDDRNWYEFTVGERGVYHFGEDGSLYRQLTIADLANKRIQLGSNKFKELPKIAIDMLEEKPVCGDPGSDAPSLFTMMDKNLLTTVGNRAYAESESYALKTINKNGDIGTIPSDLPWMTVGDYQNGHNIPLGTIDLIRRNYKTKGVEILGLSVSEPYWMRLNIGGSIKWVLWQAFERGTVTFDPKEEKDFQFQGGLVGNLFVVALNTLKKGDENPQVNFFKRYFVEAGVEPSPGQIGFWKGTKEEIPFIAQAVNEPYCLFYSAQRIIDYFSLKDKKGKVISKERLIDDYSRYDPNWQRGTSPSTSLYQYLKDGYGLGLFPVDRWDKTKVFDLVQRGFPTIVYLKTGFATTDAFVAYGMNDKELLMVSSQFGYRHYSFDDFNEKRDGWGISIFDSKLDPNTVNLAAYHSF